MSKTDRSPSVPKVEVDQRSREARLRLEQVERLLIPRSGGLETSFRRLCSVPAFGREALLPRPADQ